ncbi:HNH/endonuclease VII fold toxin-2 domain-containing protein [Thauera sp. SDU_THAU2]|uniref:HNH/endonuclease VII fold toxin-2 domain-containing protein n=1 Tax=Thauera sp. SDU_THAU2 TaxID=3136633 RepID=UPI00311E8C2E
MTVPNTPTNYYMDTAATKRACSTELKLIDKKCKPTPPKNDGKPTRKSGLSGKVANITDKLDEAAKKTAGYNRDRSTSAFNGNAWMDEHCSGLWITPPRGNDGVTTDIQDLMKEIGDKLDMGVLDKVGMLKDAVKDIADIAREVIDPSIVDDIMFKLGAKTAIKGGVGVLGAETVAAPIAMALWTAYDLYDTATTLAELAGDKGKAALEAFKSIYDIGDEAKKIADQLVKEPAKAMTNLMTLMAKLDPCIRARKCLLVPYKKTTGNPTKAIAQARHGDGCCPGQTGHHIIPDSAIKDAGCAGYNANDAPVICLEGTKNAEGWGSHGTAHQQLKLGMINYQDMRTLAGLSPNVISYSDMADAGIAAVRETAARQCDPACLRAQLDEYYDKCKNNSLTPTDGTGPYIPKSEPNNDQGR